MKKYGLTTNFKRIENRRNRSWTTEKTY